MQTFRITADALDNQAEACATAAATPRPTPEGLNEITLDLRYRQPQRVVAALWPLAQQYGMSRLAQDTGISRAHLYRLFGDMRNPEFNTLLQLFGAFGVRLSADASMDERA